MNVKGEEVTIQTELGSDKRWRGGRNERREESKVWVAFLCEVLTEGLCARARYSLMRIGIGKASSQRAPGRQPTGQAPQATAGFPNQLDKLYKY